MPSLPGLLDAGAMTELLPIRSDAELDDLVEDAVGLALRRQCWLLFIDPDSRALPLVMPCDDLPEHPDELDGRRLAAFIRHLLDETGAAEAVVVWERPGTRWLAPGERTWRRLLEAERVPIRAQYRSSSEGVVRL